MELYFLGQGLHITSNNPVGENLITFLSDKSYHAFTAMVAFTSLAGARGLSSHIKAAKRRSVKIMIITGVDQKGTSKEALEELLTWGVDIYVFYHPGVTIFHPKIYLFEGKEKSELIVGSSNLTTQGLFTNIEASVLISLDNKVEKDTEIITQLKQYYKALFEDRDINLKKLDTALIEELVKAKIVPTEAERKAQQDKEEKADTEIVQSDISSYFPKRPIPRVPKEFFAVAGAPSSSPTKILPRVGNASAKGNLVWKRDELPPSSVQISNSENTHVTGGLRLVKGDFRIGGQKIDHTTYFRDLFDQYNWEEVNSDPFVEVADVPFEITIKGKFYGTFILRIRHKPTGEAKQGNYTTLLSWGEMGTTIANLNLAYSSIEIYAPPKQGAAFQIVIS